MSFKEIMGSSELEESSEPEKTNKDLSSIDFTSNECNTSGMKHFF